MLVRFLVTAALVFNAALTTACGQEPIRVFVLAGQSNMEGKAPNALFEVQAEAESTRELFAHLRRDGQWRERDDVYIKFLDRHGPLTVGYGSPGKTGVELEFGWVLGEYFDEPIVLVKAAWGGHSLFKHFRPPSSGLPDDGALKAELDQARQRVQQDNERNQRDNPLPTLEHITADYGVSYRNMIEEVRHVLAEGGALFPQLKGRSFAVAGFVWFQGWNDQYGSEHEYALHLRHLIDDVRREFRTPALPVVVAAMGQNGSQPAKDAMRIIQEAQLSIDDAPPYAGNVKAIRTDEWVDKAAEDLYPSWRENTEQWNRTGGDHPYHYLGSAIWFTRIGRAMGEAMLELIDRPSAE